MHIAWSEDSAAPRPLRLCVKKTIWIYTTRGARSPSLTNRQLGSDSIFILRTQRYRTARGQYWHVAEAGVRVEMMKIESDPNFFLENRFKQRNPQWPVVAVAEPFQSTVQLPFPKNGASVTGISSPTLDRRVPHPGNPRRTSNKAPRVGQAGPLGGFLSSG